MLVSADEVAATLRLVVPGFVALSVFYWFGLAVKRPDWRWTVWSLLASVPLTWLSSRIAEPLGASSDELRGAFADCGVKAAQEAQSLPALRESLSTCGDQAVN